MNLSKKLLVGVKIKLGKQYCENRGLVYGEVITLVEGSFEYENGLFTEVQTAPAVWNPSENEFDSIYHLFGNDFEEFEDCEILSS